MLYQAYQAHADLMLPLRVLAGGSAQVISLAPLGITDNGVTRNLTAAYELIARSGLSHERPPYGISSVMVGNCEVEVFGSVAGRENGFKPKDPSTNLNGAVVMITGYSCLVTMGAAARFMCVA